MVFTLGSQLKNIFVVGVTMGDRSNTSEAFEWEEQKNMVRLMQKGISLGVYRRLDASTMVNTSPSRFSVWFGQSQTTAKC